MKNKIKYRLYEVLIGLIFGVLIGLALKGLELLLNIQF
jgi:hypothetical protein